MEPITMNHSSNMKMLSEVNSYANEGSTFLDSQMKKFYTAQTLYYIILTNR